MSGIFDERAMLSQVFPLIDEEIIDDVFHQCQQNYQQAYRLLIELFPSSNDHNSSAHQTLPTLQRPLPDLQQIQYWSNPESRHTSNFRHVTSRISVVQSLMGSSHTDQKISALQRKIKASPLQESATKIIAKFVATAFDLKTVNRSKSFIGFVPGDICNGNYYSGCKSLHDSLPSWQRSLLCAALNEMRSHNDKYSLQLLCALMLRASQECNARKQEIFFKVIQNSASNDKNIDRTSNQIESLEQHKKVLFDAAMIPIDEIKDYAFKGIFLEPTKMYFNAIGDHVMEGDVEVHGSNVYLAILLATLGVKLCRSPLLDDEPKGIAPVREALKTSYLHQCWDTKNKGASWELIFQNRSSPSMSKRVSRNTFYVSGRNPKEIALNCCNLSRHHESIEPYLDAYASYFEKDRMVHILCNFFLSQDNLHRHLDAIFVQLASREEVEDSNGQTKYWL
jgi:hypothetical protein